MNDFQDGVLIEPWNICCRCYNKKEPMKKELENKIIYGTRCPICKLETIIVVTTKEKPNRKKTVQQEISEATLDSQ